MKRIATASIIAASLLAAGAAGAAPVVITANADTYVKLENKEGYGTLTQISVNKAGDGAGGDTRKGVIEFLKPDATPVRTASLALDVLGFADPGSLTSATFLVWGVKEVAGCAEDFNESSADYRSFPYFDSSGDGVINSGSCLYDGNLANVDASPLGTFTVKSTDVGKTVTFSSQALIDFINSDTNGVITIAITSGTNSSSLVTTFAAKEHATRSPARLSLDPVGRLSLTDSEAFAGALSTNADGSKHFEGTLSIPVAVGQRVTLPFASVDMTFDSSGDLQAINGSVGYPELPAGPLFDGLGAFEPTSMSGPALLIGYDTPDAFDFDAADYLGLPLSPTTKYFYFLKQDGVSIEWGPLTASTPGAGAALLALAPSEPSIFFYSDQLFDDPVGGVAVGVSGGNAIHFTPANTDFVETQMKSFDGDLFFGAALAFPTPIPNVSFTVEGGMTANVDNVQLTSGNFAKPADIKKLGANAEFGLEAALGEFVTLSYHLGDATVYYDRGGSQLTFAGEVDPDDLFGLAFQPDGRLRVAGHLDGDDSKSFLVFDGKVKFPLVKQEIDAYVRLTKSSGTISGKAKFAGTTVSVSGEVHKSYAKFKGKVSHNFNAYVGKVKTTIEASIDTRNTQVGFGVEAKFCTPNWLGIDSCDSIGGDAEVNGSGQIRVCVDVPGYGDACSTLN